METKNSSSSKMIAIIFFSIGIIVTIGIAMFFIFKKDDESLTKVNSDTSKNSTQEEVKNDNTKNSIAVGEKYPDTKNDETVKESDDKNKMLTYTNSKYYFDITNANLTTGSVYYFTVENSNKETLFKTKEFVFNPNDAIVNSLGEASLVGDLNDFTYFENETPLKINLYEVTPDSNGNTSGFLVQSYNL